MTAAARGVILQDYLAGSMSAEIALMRLLLEGASVEAIATLLAAPPDMPGAAARLSAIRRVFATSRSGLAASADMLAASPRLHRAADLSEIARLFDRAVTRSPEASVALYSLGEPAILAAASAEIVEWLGRRGLVDRDRDVVDLGCGIGRIALALAPRVRSVLGLDLSPAMIAEARRRGAGLGNVDWRVTDGRDLGGVADGAADLVLAVDSFPYLMQVGTALAQRHVVEAARVLRPGGALVVLNLSYRGDPAADRADMARFAAAAKLSLALAGVAAFRLWDALAFELRKPA